MIHLPDYAVAAFWFPLTAFLGTVGWTVAGRLVPNDTISHRIASTVVLSWAHIVAVGTALGAAGLLLPAALLGGVTAAATVTLVLMKRVSRPELASHSVGMTDDWTTQTRFLWPVLWALVFAFGVAHAILGGLLQFPTDWDTLMYHLPLVDHWLQAQSLYAPDCLRWSDPANNEMITLWLVGPFSGDFLSGLTNLPATLLLGCGAIELGRQVGLSVSFRHLAGLAVVTNYVVLNQLADVENDVAVAALFLIAFANVLRHLRTEHGADLILLSVSLGMLAGVKYYALGYALVVAATAILHIAGRRGISTALHTTVFAFLGSILFGGYWYARNWIAGGSPFFPLWAPNESGDLGPVYPHIWQTTFVGNGRPELLTLSIEAVWAMGGPCHLTALLALPVTLVWLVASCVRRGRRIDGWKNDSRLPLAFATAAALSVLLVTPFAVEDVPGTLNQMHWRYCPVRYGLCALSLSVLVLAVALQDVARHLGSLANPDGSRRLLTSLPVAAFALLTAGEVYQLAAETKPEADILSVDQMLLTADIFLMGAIGYLGFKSWPRLRVAFALVLVMSVAVGIPLVGERLADRWHRGFITYYDQMLAGGLFRHFTDTHPPGTAVCVLDMRAYPFFGSARQFRVCQPVPVHSRQWLTEYAQARKIDIVAARFDLPLSPQGWKQCRIWLSESGSSFVLVRGKPWPYTVFRVVQEE